MKKDFRIWILGIFICCACSNDVTLLPPTSSGKPISFASSESTTRAQLTTTANMNSMAIFAYHTAGDFDAATATPNYMFNTPVNKINGVWTYSPVLFWPIDNSKLSFFAITPAPTADNGISVETTVTTAGYPTFKITPKNSPTEQIDFCAAAIANATYEDPDGDGIPANEADKGKVRLPFSHAMSKISFKASYTTSASSTISIQSVAIEFIEITGVAGSGEVKLLPNGKYTWTGNTRTDGKYILEQAKGDLIDTPLLKKDEVATEGADMISTQQGTLCLVPQVIPNGAQLTVYIKIKLSDAKTIGYLYRASLSGIWEAGKVHTYNITVHDLDVKLTTKETKDFSYTSNVVQTYNVFMDGTYKIEIWGNQGGRSNNGGKGGYTAGEIELTAGDVLNIYVGQYNYSNNYVAGWNGGGSSGGPWGDSSPGAGAIDVRFKVMKGNYGDFKILDSATNSNPLIGLTGVEATDPRIIVGGGGGGKGGAASGYSRAGSGGYAGGLEGESSKVLSNGGNTGNTDYYSGKGGTQDAGGASGGGDTKITPSSAGKGADVGKFGNAASGGGGGGAGWWGGGGGTWQPYNGAGGGGGGSSHVHSTLFTNIVYKTGNETFLAPGSTEEVGHVGGGLVRITRLPVNTP